LEWCFEVVDELVGEDFSGGDVVAVGEAAGEAEDLVVFELRWILEQLVDVEGVNGRASELEGVSEFAVAVGAGGSQEDDAGGGHFWSFVLRGDYRGDGGGTKFE
jgi:hypothetical protein